MRRLALKPDSSFFRKIATGAVGTRAICADLLPYGHNMVELERGSTDTKLWKDVKRKRVRIPDLVCTDCGARIESRAKTRPELSMSHSTDASRAWDFGLVDGDWIAFPICEARDEDYWSSGMLRGEVSYWHERNWVRWRLAGSINYFRVSSFRQASWREGGRKGATEGSETTILWEALFSTIDGSVVAGNTSPASDGPRTLCIRRASDGRRGTRRLRQGMSPFVQPGDTVLINQVVAGTVPPLNGPDLHCQHQLPPNHIAMLLASRERTQRYTGVKLARLRRELEFVSIIRELATDPEEDVYIRLEGACYLTAVGGESARDAFADYLANIDEQTQLEAVITLSEAGTPEAVGLLSGILARARMPFFLRSAAAWALGRVGTPHAVGCLVEAFSDVSLDLRDEALECIVSTGPTATPVLLAGLQNSNTDIAAGCAEALREQGHTSDDVVRQLVGALSDSSSSLWSVWLAGLLPREHLAASIADLQESRPELQYALSLLWAFSESWIARRWEIQPQAVFSRTGSDHGG